LRLQNGGEKTGLSVRESPKEVGSFGPVVIYGIPLQSAYTRLRGRTVSSTDRS
jgi:hypothetical protein